MIRQVTAYQAECNGCGRKLNVGSNPATVEIFLAMNGWEISGGKVTCDACLIKATKTTKGKRR